MTEGATAELDGDGSETETKEANFHDDEAYVTDQTIAMYFWAMKKLLPKNSKYHSTV